MPDLSKNFEGTKFMWDCVVYATEQEARDMKKKYEDDRFEVRQIEEEGQHLLYTQRVVTEIVVEGEPPPA